MPSMIVRRLSHPERLLCSSVYLTHAASLHPPCVRHVHRSSANAYTKSESGSSTSDSARPKRPSPYRLLQPHTFLASFAPLHVKGWRLDMITTSTVNSPLTSTSTSTSTSTPASTSSSSSAIKESSLEIKFEDHSRGVDLQDRRLVRVYDFPPEREGWSGLTRFFQQISDIIQEENHHPGIIISPATDYNPTSSALERPSQGQKTYVLEISTYTHTPMPPRVGTGENNKEQGPIRPGVTGKDIRLAERVEEVFQAIQAPL